MAKVGRNEACSCGSGKKSKRCCFSPDRLAAEAELSRSMDELCDEVVADLADREDIEFHALFQRLPELPAIDLSLQVRLPALSTPAIEDARDALEEGDMDGFSDAAWEAAFELDSPQLRLELARAVLALRDAGRIETDMAAVTVIDLCDGYEEESVFFVSSVAQSIAVRAGEASTPSGLIISAA